MSDDSDSHEHVLNSDKPDNKLEFFWLTFKDSIRDYLNETELDELSNVSQKLNDLQQEERYDEIEVYIKSHIEIIGYNMMSKGDNYRINHLDTNIRRWNKLTGNDIYPSTNTFYCILLIYINLSKSKANKKEQIAIMKDCIKRYSTDSTDHEILIELMNHSIKNKMFGNIDKLRKIVDIKEFIKPDDIEKLSDEFINNAKSNKLYKYLDEKKPYKVL